MSKKEQLEEEQPVDVPVKEEKKEEVKEDVKEEVSEESKEEESKTELVEEKNAEEVPEEVSEEVAEEVAEEVPEEVAEEVAEEVPADKPDEEVEKEVETTKEELAVIKEVRDELVNLYAKNKELKMSVETLSKEKEQLSKDYLQTKEQLSKYLEAEKLLKIKQHNTRVEKLSKKFSILGQNKSVEYLSGKSEETLSEFEQIVDAALDRSAESKEQLSVTEPSQGQELSDDKTSEEKPVEEKPKVEEKLSDSKFFAGLLGKLTEEQVSHGDRAINL